MLSLKEVVDTKLTDHVNILLHRASITTLRELFDADDCKISKITNLTVDSIVQIKTNLLNRYGPKRFQLLQYYNNIWKRTVYQTGIESLDNILNNEVCFGSDSVWEVCGLAGIGKTQLCHTIALNFVSSYDAAAVLYIDTKCDFSGIRIRQMLRSRNIDKTNSGRIMTQIKVERILTAEGVVNILKQILKQLELGGVEEVNAIKLIIIDSLPAVWLIFRGDNTERMHGKYLLATMASLVNKLSEQHFIAFFLVNLSTTVEVEEQKVQNDYVDDPSTVCNDHVIRPVLGRTWSSVPAIRLSLEMPAETNEDNALRVIKVLKSCYSRTGDSCNVYICDAGVV